MKTRNKILALLAVFLLCIAMLPVTVSMADDELTDKSVLWTTLTNPDEDKNGDVTLTVVTTEGKTETFQYANIMDAVQKLFSYMNHGDNYQTTTSYSATTTWYNPSGRGYNWSGVDYTWDYSSATISFTEAHCEYITTSVQFKSSTSGWQYASLNNVTFDGNGTGSIVGDPAQSWTGDVVVSGGSYGNTYGYGSYSNLKGTLTISGDNCTIQNTSFVGNHTWAFTYYTQDNAIGVGSGVTGLTIQNNSFTGYTLVTAFGQSGGTVTNEVFKDNYVDGCLFLFHTADGGATNLTVTNNTLIGSATYTLASCMAYTTIEDFSGNTLTYASFGLQNCETDMAQFLSQNTYDHGYIYQETVDYSWTDEELGNGTYYYLPSSTTVMTILPEGVYQALWISDYDTAGEMDSALTFTQQDAIKAAAADSEDPTYATLTWTGGGRDEDGNLLDGGVAIGYNYNALHLGYGKRPVPDLEKTIQVNGVGVDQDDVAAGNDIEFQLKSTVPVQLIDSIDDSYDSEKGYVGVVKEGATYTLTFHDKMNDNLELKADSINVTIGSIELGGEYYSVATTGLSDGCTFEIEMDLLTLYTAGIINEGDFGNTIITVTYTATLSKNASAGTYENTAWVVYPDGETEEDQVEVDTYGIEIYKYDQSTYASNSDASPSDANTKGLSGAVFELYSKDNDTDEYILITKLTTGDDGYITYEGLDTGTYYLKEITAPDGYVASGTVQEVVILTGSGTNNIVTFNFANAPIPSTGGAGTRMYLIGGACLIVAAGTVFIVSRKKKED